MSIKKLDRVVVCGAGPVGLAAAVSLSRLGIPVTILERQQEIADDPRAATLHPPTLEILEHHGVIDDVLQQGLKAPRFQFRDRASQEIIATFDLQHLAEETHYPFCIQLEQHKLVRLLREIIIRDELDVELRLGAEIQSVSQNDQEVLITLSNQQNFSAPWFIGCDGGRSTVRKQLDIAFEGFTYQERFLVLTTPFDFRGAYDFDYRNYMSDPSEWCALFKVPGFTETGHWRVVFPTRADETDADCLSDASCNQRLLNAFGDNNDFALMHRNLYAVSQRVAATFRRGRVMLAGDAAHVNNPLGGLGMNSGIHDAWELAQSLAEVWHGRASEKLLDRYDRRRRTIANEFVQEQTMRNKKTLEERDPEVRQQALAGMGRTAANAEASCKFLLNTSLLASVRRAAAIE